MYGIPKMQCMKDPRDLELQGDFYSEFFTYLEIRLVKCTNTTGQIKCKSDADIDRFFQGETFSLALTNSYFDYLDYTPKSEDVNVYTQNGILKQYIDDRFFFDIDSYRSKKANILLQKSSIELQDDYIQLGQFDEIPFVELQNSHFYETQYNHTERQLGIFYLRFDSQYSVYTRRIYSIMDFLGDIGGMYSSLFFFGYISVSFFSHRLFISAILKQLYQVKDMPKTKKPKKR